MCLFLKHVNNTFASNLPLSLAFFVSASHLPAVFIHSADGQRSLFIYQVSLIKFSQYNNETKKTIETATCIGSIKVVRYSERSDIFISLNLTVSESFSLLIFFLFFSFFDVQKNNQGKCPLVLVCLRKESTLSALGFRALVALCSFALQDSLAPTSSCSGILAAWITLPLVLFKSQH